MKNRIITLLLICLGSYLQAQTISIKGHVIDANTNEALPYANIIDLQKSTGTITNLDGNFVFTISDSSSSDSILISYISYESLALAISECSFMKTYKLKPKTNNIKSIDVKPGKFKVRSFMHDVINKYNINRQSEAHIAIAQYREKALYNDKYVMFNESLGYSIYTGEPGDNSPLSNYNYFSENSRFSYQDTTWQEKKITDKGTILQNISPSGGVNLLNAFRYFELWGLLSNRGLKHYKFKLDSSYFFNNREVLCINFKGKGDKGTIHIFSGNMNIYKIDSSTGKLWSKKFLQRVRSEYNVQFNYLKTIPFISSVNANYTFGGFNHSISLNILTQKFNKFELNNSEYWSFQGYSHNPLIMYQPEEWSKYNIKTDNDYSKIMKDLGTKQFDLEQQFLQRSGTWFFPKGNKREDARKIISSLKKNF